MIDFADSRKADLTVAVFPSPDPVRYQGLELDRLGCIRSLHTKAHRSINWANGGVYLCSQQVFKDPRWPPGFRVSLEQEIIPAVLSSGSRMFGFRCEGDFIDIGVPEDFARAAHILTKNGIES
jgi:D-glycero-alpha-D-manno-heptose 1-phosphate guanylyltransferase